MMSDNYVVDGLRPAVGPAVIASTDVSGAHHQHVMISGRVSVLAPSITVDTSALASGDNVHSSAITLSGLARVAAGSGLIQSIVAVSDTVLTVPLEVWLFSASPAATTFTANGAQSIAAADQSKIFAVVSLSDIYSDGTCTVLQAQGLAIPFKLASGTDGYCAIVVRGAPTFGAGTDLVLRVHAVQD